MPTTEYLMWNNEFFDRQTKLTIRNLIKNAYGLELLSEDQEFRDEKNSRKLIGTAVSQIRISLKENPLLLQHNIEFGFFRNLIGGSAIAVIFSLLILIVSMMTPEPDMRIIALIMAAVYIVPILLSRPFIKRFGHYYAKILYEQFMHSQRS